MESPSKLNLKELKKERGMRGISQGQLAALAGCSQAYIAAIEGGFGRPSMQMQERILRALLSARKRMNSRNPE